MHTTRTLHAHYMYTTRTLHAHYMYTTRTLHAHYMYTTCTHVYLLHTCAGEHDDRTLGAAKIADKSDPNNKLRRGGDLPCEGVGWVGVDWVGVDWVRCRLGEVSAG